MSNANKKLIPLSAVPAILVSLTGVTRSKATILNWVRYGCRTISADIVKLPAVMKMGQWFVTQDDIEQFVRDVG